MNRYLALLGATLVTATLAACSPGINLLGHRITFDSSGMLVHAAGQPNAHVSADGDLSIKGKVVAVTPAQRELLQRYYQQAHTVMDSGTAVGKQGIDMAKSGIDQAVASIFSKDSSAAEKQLNAQSQKIETAADTLCSGVRALGVTEHAIAASLPAFKPYVGRDQTQCRITHTTIVRHDDGTTTTTSTTSFAASTGSSAAAGSTAGNQPASAPKASDQP